MNLLKCLLTNVCHGLMEEAFQKNCFYYIYIYIKTKWCWDDVEDVWFCLWWSWYYRGRTVDTFFLISVLMFLQWIASKLVAWKAITNTKISIIMAWLCWTWCYQVPPIEGPVQGIFCRCSKMFECLVKFHAPGESGSSSSSSKLFNECGTWGATGDREGDGWGVLCLL